MAEFERSLSRPVPGNSNFDAVGVFKIVGFPQKDNFVSEVHPTITQTIKLHPPALSSKKSETNLVALYCHPGTARGANLQLRHH